MQGVPCETPGLCSPLTLVCKSGVDSEEHNLGSHTASMAHHTVAHILRGWRRTLENCGWSRSQPQTKPKWEDPRDERTTGLCRGN